MQIYNSMHNRKETFTPVHPGVVNMYVCGITAYDLCHIGHARSAVVFDVMARYLRSLGYKLTFARNFTDVDDKIINRANELGLDSAAVAEKYIQAFHDDMDLLKVKRADIEPKATEHITDMVKLCERLIADGKAYSTPSGDVYFRVRSFSGYGKLSGRNIDDMRAGARVQPGEEKEDPLDFALWKAAKPGEPSWESPWGKGRPGWHIECSAMSEKHMPTPLDIHGGGQDLIFPHHENEIAQSESDLGHEFCRYWVHNGFVQINSEKMSKSLGNFKTIRDILEHCLPEVLRCFLLSRHYRSPIDFSFEAVDESEKNVKKIYETLKLIQEELGKDDPNKDQGKKAVAYIGLPEAIQELESLEKAFAEGMADDMNTAAALGHIFGVVRLVNRLLEDKKFRSAQGGRDLLLRVQKDFQAWSEILGVFDENPAEFLYTLRDFRVKRKGLSVAEIDGLVQQRIEARKNKDFAAADAIRKKIEELGLEVRDTPAGSVWDVI